MLKNTIVFNEDGLIIHLQKDQYNRQDNFNREIESYTPRFLSTVCLTSSSILSLNTLKRNRVLK